MYEAVTADAQIDEVIQLAREIWTEHYTPIIGPEQVEYMLNTYHSREAIAREIRENNYQYYLIRKNDIAIGYIGFRIDRGELFLSKIYVHSSQRGLGTGRAAMEFIKGIAREQGAATIHLTVNRFNSDTIAAYEKFGFIKTGEVCNDIGQGFFMDDYTMELKL